MSTTTAWMTAQLDQRRSDGLFRSLKPYHTLIDFCSNDYLGLARDKVLTDRIHQQLDQWNVCAYASTGSRLISGHWPYHEEAESFIAQQHQAESALLFDNGYSANHGLIACVAQKGVDLVMDAHCHASMIHTAQQSMADHVYKFRHNDLEDLQNKLKRCSGRKIVLVESVYSMDGDHADIPSILAICKAHQAQLIIDEAHAFGWKGARHIGDEHGVDDVLLARVFTYGKGAGCHGAAIVSSAVVRHYLINFCKTFVYSTSTTAHLCAAIMASYAHIVQDTTRTQALHQVIYTWNKMHNQGTGHFSPIQIIKHREAAALCAQLQDQGFGIKAILPPTVGPEQACLRICLHSFQQEDDMQNLSNTLNTWI